MVKGKYMTVQNYLMINKQTNIVDNIVMWDGNLENWNPTSEYLMLPLVTTMAFDWFWSDTLQDWELQENMGGGNIGDTWDGSACITSATKESNQPYPTTEN